MGKFYQDRHPSNQTEIEALKGSKFCDVIVYILSGIVSMLSLYPNQSEKACSAEYATF